MQDVSSDENDFVVKFLQLKGPPLYFNWLVMDDKCWVPAQHVVSVLSTPQLNTSGQYYLFSESKINDTENISKQANN